MKTISVVLKSVFDVLTKDSSRFIDWYAFQTTEIVIDGIEYGIGINADFSAIKLFTIKTAEYKKDDYRKFNQTFRIGKPDSGIECWSIGVAQSYFYSNPENFSTLSRHFSAANEIIKMIEKASSDLCEEYGKG